MAFGNAVGQGFVNPSEIITNIVIIEGDNGELLMYSGTPAAGTLIYSISNRTFYDSYGNEIIGGGAASYLPVVSGDSLATLTNAGGVSYLSGPAGGGVPLYIKSSPLSPSMRELM